MQGVCYPPLRQRVHSPKPQGYRADFCLDGGTMLVPT